MQDDAEMRKGVKRKQVTRLRAFLNKVSHMEDVNSIASCYLS